MKKLLIIGLISVLLIAGCTQNTLKLVNKTNDTQECIRNEIEKAPEEYAPGDIIVGFKEDVKEDEAKSLLNSLNLTFEFNSPLSAAIVKVPKGYEIEWICKIKNYDIVRYAELNGIYKAADI